MDPKIAALFKKAKSAPADPNFLSKCCQNVPFSCFQLMGTMSLAKAPRAVSCARHCFSQPHLKVLLKILVSPPKLIFAFYTEKYGPARAVDTKTAWAALHRAEAPAPTVAPVKK